MAERHEPGAGPAAQAAPDAGPAARAPTPPAAAPALLSLRGVSRDFASGDQTLTVLRDIALDIRAGEMVAIVGASGSGKSTLMNILGCLDRPTRGSYRVAGRDTAELLPDELAQLRREHFGFIFQRYHLLADLPALGNVEVPAVYAGSARAARRARAAELLARLGLADRDGHRPGQLSGGQQQRVSIARALMNGGEVILADEPTGALDSASGAQVMAILRELHADGHAVILVTHDMAVAAHAARVIELKDGVVVADRPNLPVALAAADDAAARAMAEAAHAPASDDAFAAPGTPPAEAAPAGPPGARRNARPPAGPTRLRALGAWADRFAEAFRMALVAMRAHALRTFLTMLGIVIGIASVVSVVALGEGSRQSILKSISSIGTNTIDVMPGKDFGDMRSGAVQTLRPRDADALAGLSYVDSVTPSVQTTLVLRHGNQSSNGAAMGVGEQYFRVKGIEIAQGRFFGAEAVQRLAQDAVIDENTRRALFGARQDVLGETLLIGAMPARIVGVTKKKDSAFGSSENLQVFIPYTTAMGRLTGATTLRAITVRTRDEVPSDIAEAGITRLLALRHGTKDFFTMNTDSIRQTIESTTQTMTLLIASIAVISLVVGGIGVMNIMLVSVTERTREIGVRMAVGARQGDILQQFLIEAVLVCLIGGVLGIGLALAIGAGFAQAGGSFGMVFSGTSMVAAFACSTLIGVVFGFLPARSAARLDPVDALARE
ncbi:MacB family efflux pump subunit [Derxia gummosa]|uniref:Pyoverdine export ATP-binding/permease protein PvdT n=1 Tax=Derxia gummosa DSM 723 TaxID=1121388 RepID=A0A8B6XA07_9BURK|nr:MacB family efflux pump subunit [Derxia gummosa]